MLPALPPSILSLTAHRCSRWSRPAHSTFHQSGLQRRPPGIRPSPGSAGPHLRHSPLCKCYRNAPANVVLLRDPDHPNTPKVKFASGDKLHLWPSILSPKPPPQHLLQDRKALQRWISHSRSKFPCAGKFDSDDPFVVVPPKRDVFKLSLKLIDVLYSLRLVFGCHYSRSLLP